jgi:putative serine protease PepD
MTETWHVSEHDTFPFPYAGSEPPPPGGPDDTTTQRHPRGRGPLVAGLAVTALVAGTVGGVIGAQVSGGNGTASSALATASSVAAPTGLPRSYAAIAARVLPSVVNIDVVSGNSEDTGSGVIIRSDGYILTNNHVVAAATSGGQVAVTFNDGTTVPARIVGTDLVSDLAVIHVARTGLRTATLGSSSSLQVGDPVVAFGSPLGLSGTVTSGIVSALNRPVDTTPDQTQQANPFFGQQSPTPTALTVFNAIQTDAAINPGNSGGPLVDGDGQVVGIDSAIASLGSSLGGESGNIGVGFAIPVDQARVIAGELIKSGHATHPVLGVGIPGDTTELDATHPDGFPLPSVASGGPAAKAGIKAGDVVTTIDGLRVTSAAAMVADIRSQRPGETVRITYRRGANLHTVNVTLASAASSTG